MLVSARQADKASALSLTSCTACTSADAYFDGSAVPLVRFRWSSCSYRWWLDRLGARRTSQTWGGMREDRVGWREEASAISAEVQRMA